jgi:uncharacterized protein (TIGR03382 family)
VARSEGLHTVRARATDTVGNTGDFSSDLTFTIDVTAPVVPTLDAPADAVSTADTTPTFTASAAADVVAVRFVVDATVLCTDTSAPFECTPGTALAEGTRSWTARAVDAAGNVSADATARSIFVDSIAPATAPTFSSPAPAASVNVNVDVSGGGGVAGDRVRIFVDGAATHSCEALLASASWTCSLTGLSEGGRSLTARFLDAVDNEGPLSGALTVTVDGTPPSLPVINAPVSGLFFRDTTPEVSGSAEAGTTVEVWFDSALAAGCTAVASATGEWACSPSTALSEAAHVVRARAIDAAGNDSGFTADRGFTVDATAPALPSLDAPTAGSYATVAAVAFSGGRESGSTVTVRVDGNIASSDATVSTLWSCTSGALGEGSHDVVVFATDAAGNNSGDSVPRTFHVDTVMPATPSITLPVNGTAMADPTPDFGGGGEAGSTVSVTVGGAVVCTALVTGATWSCTSSSLSDGLKSATAQAVDVAGNPSGVSAAVGFTVDTTPTGAPVITPFTPPFVRDTTPLISGLAESDASRVEVSIGGAAYCDAIPSSGGWSCAGTTPLAEGPFTATAVAFDVLANASVASTAVSFTVDTTVPSVPVLVSPVGGAALNSGLVSFGGTREADTRVTVRVGGADACVDTGGGASWSCSVSAPLADGSHSATAFAVDAAGNPSLESAPVTFTVDTLAPAAPMIVAPVAGTTLADSTPEISGTAETGVTSVEVSIGGAVVCLAPVSGGQWACSGSSSRSDGATSAEARAIDAAGNRSGPSSAVSFSIDTTAPDAPVVGAFIPVRTGTPTPSIAGASAADAVSIRVAVDGTDVCVATPANGAWFCTSSVSLLEGAHSVVAFARDAVGNESGASAPVTLFVDLTSPAAPVITGPATASNDVSPLFSGTAEEDSEVTVTVNSLEACVAMADSAGAWSCESMIDFTDGTLEALAVTVDVAGNESLASAPFTFIIDTLAPISPVVVTPVAGGIVNTGTPLFSGTGELGSVVHVARLSGEDCFAAVASDGSWSCSPTTLLTDGDYSFQVHASDAAGNVSDPPVLHAVTVDTLLPAAPVLTAPADGALINAAMPLFSGTGEPGTTATVRVDGNSVCTGAVAGSGVWSCTASAAISDGTHSWTARLTDLASNEGPDATARGFSLDATAPVAPEILLPVAASFVTTDLPTVSGNSEAGSSVAVTLDGNPFCTVTASGAAQWSCTAGASIGDGPHTLVARAADVAGNASPDSATVTFTVDTQAPPAPVFIAPLPSALLSVASPSFSGTASAESAIEVRVDGAVSCTATSSATGEWSCTASAALLDGPHTATARARDAAGNAGPLSAPLSFFIDSQPPGAPVVLSPTGVVRQLRPLFSGSAEAGTRVQVRVDGNPVCTGVTLSGAWSCSLSADLAQGAHTVVAVARDGAGNESAPSASVSFSVDTVGPVVVALLAPAENAYLNSQRPSFSGTAEEGATVTVKVDGVTACMQVVPAGGAWSCAPASDLGDGAHAVLVEVRDAAGNSGADTVSRTFTIDTVAPLAPVLNSPEASAWVRLRRPVFSGLVELGATVTVRVEGAVVCTDTPSGTSWSCSAGADLSEGAHSVVLTATDRAGNASPPSSASDFNVDATPPVVTLLTMPPATNAPVTASFTFECAGGESCVFRCQIDQLGWGVCASPAEYADLANGGHRFEVSAADRAGNLSAVVAFDWSVGTPPPDAGSVVPDAGAAEPDAGAGEPDAGTGGSDAGTTPGNGLDPVGCGCSTGAELSLAWLALAALIPLRMRRRR